MISSTDLGTALEAFIGGRTKSIRMPNQSVHCSVSRAASTRTG